MHIADIIRRTRYGELDYNLLVDLLQGYGNPRQKISAFLRKGQLIRVKKGIYVYGQGVGGAAYSPAILANMVYGPSYISTYYALATYGLIPERVYEVTSVTNKRQKKFTTPVGVFSYKYLGGKKFPAGVTQYAIDQERHVLMASKEKAIVDIIWKDKALQDKDQLCRFLTENLRIEETALAQLDVLQCKILANVFGTQPVTLLHRLIQEG